METLGFIIDDISRLFRRRFDARARAVGVTYSQWRLLITVSRNEGVNQIWLAEFLEVEAITICRMIDRLHDVGLVERRRDPTDRRAWRIYLTELAHPLLKELYRLAHNLAEESMAGLIQSKREMLSELLSRVRANLADPAFTADQTVFHMRTELNTTALPSFGYQ